MTWHRIAWMMLGELFAAFSAEQDLASLACPEPGRPGDPLGGHEVADNQLVWDATLAAAPVTSLTLGADS